MEKVKGIKKVETGCGLSRRIEWRMAKFHDDHGIDILHHPTQPAIQYKNGDWVWWIKGKKTRLDGPAEKHGNSLSYWIDSQYLTYEEWEKHPLRLEWLRNKAGEI